MKRNVLAVLALLGAAETARAQADLEAGKKAFNRCASCHPAPDLRLRWDQLWYALVPGSVCAAPAPGPGVSPLDDRRPLLAYLAAESTPRPARVDAESPITPDLGTVTANIEEGYLHLAPKQEKPKKNQPTELLTGYRLVWKKDEKERRRPLPEGVYFVRRYAVSREDAKTGEWTILATGEGRSVSVKAGEETKVTLDLDVTFESRPSLKGTKITVGGLFKGDRDMGLSVFRNGRRLEVGWKVFDGKQDLAAGGCAYGAEGVFSGVLDLQAGQRIGAAVAKYHIDLVAFRLKGNSRETPIR